MARASLSVVAFVLLASVRPVGQAMPPLFEDATRPGVFVTLDTPAGTSRARQVSLRADVLTVALSPGADRSPGFVLNLFPDVQLRLERERLELGAGGHVSWVGHVQGESESTASLTWDGQFLTGGVVSKGAAYDINSSGGVVVVTDRDVAVQVIELPALVAPVRRGAEGPTTRLDPSSDAGTANIDILVLYTPAARARAGGTSQIQSQLANAVAVTNTAFQRSGVNAVLTAVGVQELAYTESAGLNTDLYAISSGGTANATVEALRTAAGADLVALVTGRSTSAGGCGIAWLGPSSAAVYSATEHACLYAGQWSFSHELGHNFGADHAPGDTSPIGVSYAHGYREGTIRTLMAYAVAGSPPRLLNYSSASILEPAGTGIATGNSLQDNARRLGETVATAAAYLAPAGGSGTSVPAAPSGLAAYASSQPTTFAWSIVTGASSYLVQIGTSPGDSSIASLTTSGPSHVRMLAPGTYCWRVRAQNSAGLGPVSAESTLVVAPAPALPGTPNAFNASVNGTTVTLSWAAPNTGGTLTGYELEVGSMAGAGNIGRYPLAGSPASFANVPAGTYYTRLRTVGPGGSSAPTADVPVVVGGSCAPPGAISVSGAVSGGTVSLTWTTPSGSGPFNYLLGVGSQPGLFDIGVFPMGATNTYVVAPPSRNYYVKAAATNACGMGPISGEVLISVP